MKTATTSSFDEFFTMAEERTTQTLDKHKEAVAILRSIYDTFEPIFEAMSSEGKMVPALLLQSALMTWLASIREASTGNLFASTPLFRVSLEAACYAYRISEKTELRDIWLNRGNNEDSRKICRKKFTSAVKDTARSIAKRDAAHPETECSIMEAYENAIDLGAHPNSNAILARLQIDDKRTDNKVETTLGSIFESDSSEVKQLLVGSIEYGQFVAIIGACCSRVPDEQIFKTLDDINDRKEQYIEAKFEFKA